MFPWAGNMGGFIPLLLILDLNAFLKWSSVLCKRQGFTAFENTTAQIFGLLD